MRKLLITALAGTALILSGCSSTEDTEQTTTPETSRSAATAEHQHNHSADGGAVPESMVPAVNPTFPLGSKVRLNTDHMDGMQGAEATIVGAFSTYTYAVDYTPTTGGAEVENHKWVVQEEIADAGSDRLPDGTTVTLLADHMDGMNGAEATVVSSTDETVYVVDFDMDGMMMKNHMWVVDSEIEPES